MTDFALFSTLIDCIRQGGSPVLCTIVDSAGSAPRGAGARMALLPDGTWLGTVGGGCLAERGGTLPYLADGDTVEIRIERIGTLRQYVKR